METPKSFFICQPDDSFDQIGVAVALKSFIIPNDVSFSNIEVREECCPAVSSGTVDIGADHQQWKNFVGVMAPEDNIRGSMVEGPTIIMCEGNKFEYCDFAAFSFENYNNISGRSMWKIPWSYNTDVNSSIQFAVVEQSATIRQLASPRQVEMMIAKSGIRRLYLYNIR